MTKYDVGIVSFGSCDIAILALRSVWEQSFPPTTVVVVENSQNPAAWSAWKNALEQISGDALQEVEASPGARETFETTGACRVRTVLVWSSRNGGFCDGNNLALRWCHSERYLSLNPDCVLDRHAAVSLYSQLVPPIAVVSGALRRSTLNPNELVTLDVADPRVSLLTGRTVLDMSRTRGRLWHPRVSVGRRIYAGACALFDRNALDAIGGFPASQFLFYDEFVVVTRLRRFGYAMSTIPDVVGSHDRHSTTRASGQRSSLEVYHAARSSVLAGFEAGWAIGLSWLLARCVRTLAQGWRSPRLVWAGTRGLGAGLSTGWRHR